MNTNRKVTEQDFRMPEFRGADPNDYEFRGDGKIVRKDRWETGIRKIASIVFHPRHDFEIENVVEEVRTVFNRSRRTAREIVDQTNQIAAWIAERDGFQLEHPDYHKAEAPRAISAWKLACKIQDLLTATDPENAVAELDEDEDEREA